MEVELVPTLLMAARYRRRLAFSDGPWSFVSSAASWNYACSDHPQMNDVFRFSPGAADDAIELSWGTNKRKRSVEWACFVQVLHPSRGGPACEPYAAKHLAALTDGCSRGATSDAAVLTNAFESVAIATRFAWSRIASGVRTHIDARFQSFSRALGEGGYNAVHIRGGDKATELTSLLGRKLVNVSKHPSWWVERITKSFGNDGLPVYIASDSCALASEVVAGLKTKSIQAHSRCDRDTSSSSKGHVQSDFNRQHTCDDIYTFFSDVELLAGSVNFAAAFYKPEHNAENGNVLSNVIKLVIKLRAGRLVAEGNHGPPRASPSLHAVDVLRNVFDLLSPPGASSLHDLCALSEVSVFEYGLPATCNLAEIVGLNYDLRADSATDDHPPNIKRPSSTKPKRGRRLSGTDDREPKHSGVAVCIYDHIRQHSTIHSLKRHVIQPLHADVFLHLPRGRDAELERVLQPVDVHSDAKDWTRLDFVNALQPHVDDYMAAIRSSPGLGTALAPLGCGSKYCDLVSNVYSFVGLVERFDESVVLLASMLNLPLHTVLYLTSKNSSEGRRDPLGKAMVAHPTLDAEPPSVRAYAESSEFRRNNALDMRLWKAAYTTLQARWAAHAPMLEERLSTFRSMLGRARDECVPFSSNTSQSLDHVMECYWHDHGCGHVCLDRLFAR